jgi:hypothetical protein
MGVLDPNDKILTTATARNKKVAEQEASRAALELLEPSLNEAFNVMKVSSPVMTAKEPEKKSSPMPPMEEKKTPAVKKVISRRPKIAPSES